MRTRFGLVRSLVFVGVLCVAAASVSAEAVRADDDQASFVSARPIWVADRQTEKNLFVGFRTEFDAPKSGQPVLRITASSLYRVYLNGQFVGHGPARGPHGHCRIDEWPLQAASGRNVLAVEVAGYNANSYYLRERPANPSLHRGCPAILCFP